MTDLLATVRNAWRGLTSMRTALVLLFLLALAALPGALLPQRSLNPTLVDDFYARYPSLAPVLERLGFFALFASPWFAAIYLLLFVSLVGCLAPRTLEYARQLRRPPVATPRNLARLPHTARGELVASPDDVVAAARVRLRGWRVAERSEPGGVRTLSAERGYAREAGNLVFHLALLGLLVSFAVGKLVGYEGQVIVLANGSQFCNTGPAAYDSFRPGIVTDGTGLEPLCVQVDAFEARYLDSGQPDEFRADVRYQSGDDVTAATWDTTQLAVNDPLRAGDVRLYLLGHGYGPQFTVTFPDGQQRTGLEPWRPVDNGSLLSEGATEFDPPGVTDDAERRTRQLIVTGLFAPTAMFDGTLLGSGFPDLRDPAVAVDVMRGDLGRPTSVFEVDQDMVDQERLTRVARENLRPGESLTLDDGTTVRFDGVTRFVSLQVSYDPTQPFVLASSVLVLGGLGLSLAVRRRRFWLRAVPAGPDDPDGRTVVELGGLARTDGAGYGEEFDRLAADLLAGPGTAEPRVPAGAGKGT